MNSLVGKVGIITGASRGIGQAIANTLAKEGMSLALVARTESELNVTKNLCLEAGGQAIAVSVDLSQPSSWQKIVQQTEQAFGKLDVLINNAGVFADDGPADQATLEKWLFTLDVNLAAVMGLTRYALPVIEKQKRGTIINISSILGKQGAKERAAYCASKFGVRGFSEALFEDVREKGIKVCTICPGFVKTDMVDTSSLHANKLIQPEDIAQAVLFVLQLPNNACVTEMTIRPQQSPYRM